MANNNNRPVYLNLFRIHLPVTAVLSLAHRLTGVVMVALIPVLIYMLAQSLHSEQAYQQLLNQLNSTPGRTIVIIFVWFLAHHLFAGLRYFLIDMDIGVSKVGSRQGAWAVIVAGIVTMLIVSAGLL